MRPAAFSPAQVVGAVSLASLVQAVLVLAIVLTRAAGGESLQREPPPREMRIAVKPILDGALLKKGTQTPAATPPKLPDMWKPPEPKPRVEPKPLPTSQPKTIQDSRDPTPTKPEDKPTPATPQERRVDDMVKKMQREAQEQQDDSPPPPPQTEQGGEDGVVEGTEKDPLKARAVDQYSAKLINWFRQGFSVPVEIDCDTLVGLEAKVTARIGPNREVTGYSMKSSGNEAFDERVRAAMEMHVGQTVPPPPPNYPDLLEPVFFPTFQGKNEKCK